MDRAYQNFSPRRMQAIHTTLSSTNVIQNTKANTRNRKILTGSCQQRPPRDKTLHLPTPHCAHRAPAYASLLFILSLILWLRYLNLPYLLHLTLTKHYIACIYGIVIFFCRGRHFAPEGVEIHFDRQSLIQYHLAFLPSFQQEFNYTFHFSSSLFTFDGSPACVSNARIRPNTSFGARSSQLFSSHTSPDPEHGLLRRCQRCPLLRSSFSLSAQPNSTVNIHFRCPSPCSNTVGESATKATFFVHESNARHRFYSIHEKLPTPQGISRAGTKELEYRKGCFSGTDSTLGTATQEKEGTQQKVKQ